MENELQRTPEWYSQRLFRFTSSELDNLLTEPRSKSDREAGLMAESCKKYVYDKISEYITNGTILDYKDIDTREVRWGEEHEDEARSAYERRMNVKVDACGFFPYKDYFGGSPDGLVGDDGLIEIKCPYNGSIHVMYMLLEGQEDLKRVKRDYYAQIQGNFIVTGRKWCDFISFDPRVQNPALAIKVLRILPDEGFIDLCKRQLEKANKYKEEIKEKLIGMIA